jgi:hypothetical protein
MAKFQVALANGDKLVFEAEAIDNIPEFVGELKNKGYIAGRRDVTGEALALIDPHVAVVELI